MLPRSTSTKVHTLEGHEGTRGGRGEARWRGGGERGDGVKGRKAGRRIPPQNRVNRRAVLASVGIASFSACAIYRTTMRNPENT